MNSRAIRVVFFRRAEVPLSSETVICQVPDVGSMLESYGNRGIDFIIDVGPRVATVSTVRSRSLKARVH